jgi:hypothetical protein
MGKLPDPDALVARALGMRRALIVALAAAFAFLVLALGMIEPTNGVPDVHVPGAAIWVLTAQASTLAPGEPYIVGPGIGRIPEYLASAMQVSGFFALIFVIWALAKRRKPIAIGAFAWFAMVSNFGPIPTMMQPEPPIAVSPATARSALGLGLAPERQWPAEPVAWRRYMMAQIAFAEGDRGTAASLARGIESHDILSPIEGARRLQLIQGAGASAQSAVCFKSGCMTSAGRGASQLVAASLAIVALALAFGFAATLRTLRRRLDRIEELVASGRRARSMA